MVQLSRSNTPTFFTGARLSGGQGKRHKKSLFPPLPRSTSLFARRRVDNVTSLPQYCHSAQLFLWTWLRSVLVGKGTHAADKQVLASAPNGTFRGLSRLPTPPWRVECVVGQGERCTAAHMTPWGVCGPVYDPACVRAPHMAVRSSSRVARRERTSKMTVGPGATYGHVRCTDASRVVHWPTHTPWGHVCSSAALQRA